MYQDLITLSLCCIAGALGSGVNHSHLHNTVPSQAGKTAAKSEHVSFVVESDGAAPDCQIKKAECKPANLDASATLSLSKSLLGMCHARLLCAQLQKRIYCRG